MNISLGFLDILKRLDNVLVYYRVLSFLDFRSDSINMCQLSYKVTRNFTKLRYYKLETAQLYYSTVLQGGEGVVEYGLIIFKKNSLLLLIYIYIYI